MIEVEHFENHKIQNKKFVVGCDNIKDILVIFSFVLPINCIYNSLYTHTAIRTSPSS